jgi:hypothetical protein
MPLVIEHAHFGTVRTLALLSADLSICCALGGAPRCWSVDLIEQEPRAKRLTLGRSVGI